MANFKARARALDMLGRQQIAGIPTAISELFKNAHDAYADNAVADYFANTNTFVLRDDGVGMSESDFLDRWLVLGTESKLNSATGVRPPQQDSSKEPRPILGEKGIGRLAIAAIGPQLLILTRPQSVTGEEPSTRLTAAFIHWGLFEIPGVDLDEVEVQIRTFEGGQLPSQEDVVQMVEATRQNLRRLQKSTTSNQANQILEELQAFTIDPQQMQKQLGRPSLAGSGSGTHFFIKPATESLAVSLHNDINDASVSDLTKTLIGFNNTMTPGHEPARIHTIFRYHKADNTVKDLIEEGEFFTPSDFEAADHRISGYIDEMGQFSGTLSIYDVEPKPIIVPWLAAKGRPTDCGPFSINFAYVQGVSAESRLAPDEWARLNRKINQIGGLYIYRDEIRVLPYGDADVDFLDIEKRRSKGAGYYYFSYRRIFGAIELTNKENFNLSEKAGREGFRDNRAYRQFREILMHLFVQLAADYFREEGTQAQVFRQRLKELSSSEKARRRREKNVAPKRRAFQLNLEKVARQIAQGEPQNEVAKVLGVFEAQVSSVINTKEQALNDAALSLTEAENLAKTKLEEVRKSYRVTRPGGIALPRNLQRDYEAYWLEWRKLDEQVFEAAASKVSNEAQHTFDELGISLETRFRLEQIFQERVARLHKQLEERRRHSEALLSEKTKEATALIKENLSQMRNEVNDVLKSIASMDFETLNEKDISFWQTQQEGRLTKIEERSEMLLNSLDIQLQGLNFLPDEEGQLNGATEEAQALEEDVLALQERAEIDFELSQLGLAVEIVGHEFSNSIRDVRASIETLGKWAKRTDSLKPIYQSIRTSFEHLDGYLTLFTPLNRRLYRSKSKFSGASVAKFLRGLLGRQLDDAQVTLVTTEAFLSKTIEAYPSTFYPTFVNLVDNALFWVKDTPTPRQIMLDADEFAFIVSDSGPGIGDNDKEAVFEMRFTRKPGGRGLGLFIARQGLLKEGYALKLSPLGPLTGATFRIEAL